jgi:hypothetical protein
MICIQLKIKCKIILLKTLENGLNKSYFMTYHRATVQFLSFSFLSLYSQQSLYHPISVYLVTCKGINQIQMTLKSYF